VLGKDTEEKGKTDSIIHKYATAQSGGGQLVSWPITFGDSSKDEILITFLSI